MRGEEVDLSFEVERPSGEVDALLLEVLVLFGNSAAASFSEALSSSSSVDSARPPSAFSTTTSTAASTLLTSGSISPSLIVDSLCGAPNMN